ncbi:TPA: hypothetical protein DIC40_01970 [Patescibacteria group bacterium]|nr:hypothetical protein P148_SR1C00001G0281 [candidate division SR1 bacterium RAAC1_SR1_1]HCY20624.1 hypothetical protein [Candidatus Gracilibacteria bacterium]
MSNLSFKTFIQEYLPSLQKDAHFVEYVKIANILVKKYNRNIFLSDYKNSIKTNDQGLRDFIAFLGKYGFWSKKHLNILIKELQKQEKEIQFTVQAPLSAQKDIHSKVDAVLKKEFKAYSLQNDECFHLGITIKGNGYQYKRNLDSDLDILLK